MTAVLLHAAGSLRDALTDIANERSSATPLHCPPSG
jgi:hypothetical protein